MITTALRHAELAPVMPTFRTVAQAVAAVESLIDPAERQSFPRTRPRPN